MAPPQVMEPLGLAELFVFFFLMLGPLKVLVPFVQLTASADAAQRHRTALQATAAAAAALIVAAVLGTAILSRWRISLPALELAAGIVLFLVALRVVLEWYERPAEPKVQPQGKAALMQIALPGIVTPYGVAVVILVIAAASGAERILGIAAVLAAVMVLNLLVLWFAHPLFKAVGVVPLMVLGSVLGVLQVALGIEIILLALRTLGVLSR